MHAKVAAAYTHIGSIPNIGCAASASNDPKYAAPPPRPSNVTGMVVAISHRRFARLVARYSDHVICCVEEEEGEEDMSREGMREWPSGRRETDPKDERQRYCKSIE